MHDSSMQGEFIIAHPSKDRKTSVVFNGLSSPEQHYTNAELYDLVFPRLLDDVQAGYNGCVFAYGQTGSGKTYTMIGDDKCDNVNGLYVLASRDIFRYLELPEYQKFTVLVSFYEIYCGKLYDLLNNKQKLSVLEDGKQNVNIIG